MNNDTLKRLVVEYLEAEGEKPLQDIATALKADGKLVQRALTALYDEKQTLCERRDGRLVWFLCGDVKPSAPTVSRGPTPVVPEPSAPAPEPEMVQERRKPGPKPKAARDSAALANAADAEPAPYPPPMVILPEAEIEALGDCKIQQVIFAPAETLMPVFETADATLVQEYMPAQPKITMLASAERVLIEAKYPDSTAPEQQLCVPIASLPKIVEALREVIRRNSPAACLREDATA